MSKPPVTGLRERIGETRRLYENEEKFFEAVKSHRHVLEELPRVLEMLDAAAAEKLREEAVDLGKPEITR